MQNVIIPELVNLQYKGTKVLTSRQLCDAYDCKYQSIKGNFHQHKQEFIEGVDYFCIVGDELRNFKLQNSQGTSSATFNSQGTSSATFNSQGTSSATLPFSMAANKLYLWTVFGALKHSQFLCTEKARDVFSALSQAYFYGAVCNEEILNRVYAMELDDNTVKIGRSADIEKRAKRIEVISNCKVLRTYSTDFFTLEIAKQIEFACQKFFAEFLAHGNEYFNISFEDACTEIDKIAKKIQEVEESELPVPATPPEISSDIEMYCNFLDKIITLCNMTEDENLREDLIKRAVNLI